MEIKPTYDELLQKLAELENKSRIDNDLINSQKKTTKKIH